ncbi:MAG: TadE family protein [Chloroflexi bacterium]|nr:TadE family protein [Chloroflexota bacterium]
MVEAALILPMLMLLLIGIVDFGRILYHQEVLANAAREGARAGSNPNTSDATIQAATIAAALPIVLTTANVTISPSGSRSFRSGASIGITVSFNLSLITPGMSEILSALLVSGRLPLSQTAQMVIM